MYKNKKIVSYFFSGIMMMVFIAPLFVMGADNEGGDRGRANEGGDTGKKGEEIIIKNPFKKDTIKGLLETVIREIMMPIGGVIAVLMIMYSGFLFVTDQSDAGRKKAKDSLKYALIGAAILIGAWTISEAIQGTINDLKV